MFNILCLSISPADNKISETNDAISLFQIKETRIRKNYFPEKINRKSDVRLPVSDLRQFYCYFSFCGLNIRLLRNSLKILPDFFGFATVEKFINSIQIPGNAKHI